MSGDATPEGRDVPVVAPGRDRAGFADHTADLRPSRRSRILSTTALLLLVLGSVAVFVPLPYVVMLPGPAFNTLGSEESHPDKPLISVTGHPTYPAQGTLDFTTVRVKGGPGYRVNVYDLLSARLDPAEDVYDEEALFPKGSTQDQVRDENVAEMAGSQEVASALAQRALGLTVVDRIVVGSIPQGSPATGVVEPGDLLISVDGVPATTPDAIRAAVGKHASGEKVTLVVKREGVEKTLSSTTTTRDGRTVIGVNLGYGFDLPVAVTVHAGDVGGPSAGMMFGLGIYDLLTPGSLTGGAKIAGTGTVSPDGAIGPIGGIAQKMAGAQEAGSQWFLAPAADCAQARGRVPEGLRVVRVETFTGALDAVKVIGSGKGASLPTCDGAAGTATS